MHGLAKRASWEGGNMEKGRKEGMEERRREGEREGGIKEGRREGKDGECNKH